MGILPENSVSHSNSFDTLQIIFFMVIINALHLGDEKGISNRWYRNGGKPGVKTAAEAGGHK
jgi:hypothetical protein